MNALEARQISFSYPKSKLLFREVNISLRQGECVILRGPSGSGKTTLAYILAGIIPRSIPGEVEGEVLLFGQEMRTLSLAAIVQQVGVLFQDPDAQLFFPTVEDEVAFGPENLCLPRDEIVLRIDRALEAVQMTRFRKAAPDRLSHGQKQLVALAAALALEPRIMVLDEAFSQLDTATTKRVKHIIRELKGMGRSVFLVENSEDHFDLAERIYELRGGRVQEVAL